MSTIRQKRLAKAIALAVEGGTLQTKKELVLSSGYGEVTADRHASEVIEQAGVQEELANLGFTEDNAKRVVAEILLNSDEKANDRLKAAELTFKVQGSFAPDKSVNVNIDADATPVIKELTDKLNELYRGTSSPSDGELASVVGTEAPDKE